MPMARPSPEQLRDRIAAEFRAWGADPRLRRSIEGIMTRVQALATHEMLGKIEWASRQMHVATAGEEELPIRAAVYGVTPIDPLPASGGWQFSGNVGATLPIGAELRRSDDVRYITTGLGTVGSGGTGVVAITAVVAGSAGNADAGTSLTLVEPAENVFPSGPVTAPGLRGGLDTDDVDSLRARVAARIQAPPHGGADFDYAAWVQEVVGKTQVWVRPITPSPGYVTVYFLMPDGSVPPSPTVAAVQAHIDAQRPVTAINVIVVAPVVDLIPFTLALTPDAAANRLAVAAELADMLIREGEPGGTLASSRISAAISSAPGEYSHVRTVPAGSITSAAGHLPRLGTITWS